MRNSTELVDPIRKVAVTAVRAGERGTRNWARPA
jgi:hypothetical protein